MIQAFLILFISLNSWGNTSSDSCSGSSMNGVKNCIEEFNQTVGSWGVSPSPCPAIETEVKKKPFATLSEEFNVSEKSSENHCTNFITNDGDAGGYGPWGETIVKYLDEKGENSIFYNNNLAGMSNGVTACPNWSAMSVEEKKHFWVWVMASISKIESTCDAKARNGKSTNGVAVGLVQLDERKSQRSWRGDNCKTPTVLATNDNLRCGMDILGELLKGKAGEYKGNGELWGRKSGSYWQHLRLKNGGGISDLIQLNPYCKK
jgi:hypothetical protein